MIQEAQPTNEPTDTNQTEENNNNDENDDALNDEQPAENETSENQEIEGIVHGEPDNNVVQSASRFSALDDEDNKVCIPNF